MPRLAMITVNGQPHQIREAETIANLLESLDLTGKRIAVERNSHIVPKSAHSTTELVAGDTLEIVVAVGGG